MKHYVIFLLLVPVICFSQRFTPLAEGLKQGSSIWATDYDSLNNELYVAGYFDQIDTLHTYYVAMWDGTNWHSLGNSFSQGYVASIKKLGNDVYATGYQLSVDGLPTGCVFRWDGSVWHAMNNGLDSNSYAISIQEFQGKIYIGGDIATSNGLMYQAAAVYNGNQWQTIHTGDSMLVDRLKVLDSKLYLYGKSSDTTGYTLSWYDGTNWTSVNNPTIARILDINFCNNILYVATTSGIMHLNGITWVTDYNNSALIASKLIVYNNSLYGVLDSSANQYGYEYIRKFQGSSFQSTSLAAFYPKDKISCYTVSGNKLFIGGNFFIAANKYRLGLSEYNGSTWSTPGNTAIGFVDAWTYTDAYALLYDSISGDLIVGGDFMFTGDSISPNVALWDGTKWHTMGEGLNSRVVKILKYNNQIYAAGYFNYSGSTPVNFIARWNGSHWVATGTGANDIIRDMIVINNKLYVAGKFTTINGVNTNCIASFDGSNWASVGGNILWPDDYVMCLANYNNQLVAAAETDYQFDSGNFNSGSVIILTGNTFSFMETNFSASTLSMIEYNGALYLFDYGELLWRWNGATWDLLQNGVGLFGDERDKLFNFKGDLTATVSNGGFFKWNGNSFVYKTFVQPYDIAKVNDTTFYLGGFFPHVFFGETSKLYNCVGKLEYTMPSVSLTSNKDSLCRYDSIKFTPVTNDLFVQYDWHFAGGSPDTSSNYNPSTSYSAQGNYSVYVICKNDVGGDTVYLASPVHVLSCIYTNVFEQYVNTVKIYPNPATTQLNITIDESFLGAQLNIYNLTGDLISTKELQTINNQQETGNFPAGMYIAEVKTATGAQRVKLVKM